jgi:hypothetical protein
MIISELTKAILHKTKSVTSEHSRHDVKSQIVKNVDTYKNTNHQQMHRESFIINRNTLLHVPFTPPKTTQYTVNSTFSLKCKVQPQCNGNEKVLPEDDPAGSKHVGVCYN